MAHNPDTQKSLSAHVRVRHSLLQFVDLPDCNPRPYGLGHAYAHVAMVKSLQCTRTRVPDV